MCTHDITGKTINEGVSENGVQCQKGVQCSTSSLNFLRITYTYKGLLEKEACLFVRIRIAWQLDICFKYNAINLYVDNEESSLK